MNRIKIAIGFFISGALAGGGYNFVNDKIHHKEECTASLVVFKDNTQTNLTLNFMYSLAEGKGTVAVSGSYLDGGKLQGHIRRDVIYDMVKNHETHHFHSREINRYGNIDSVSDEFLATILPDFYVYPDEKISYIISKQNEHSFLIKIGSRPLLYCAN
ncbi:hypothetical protein M0J30_004511 [Klebsiella oxytoca]|uniref:hypothetical protein n=1 Tax=Klebsiella oxytoca TaxID=571 RepID=UPI000CFFD962|nr:hypothetical protein [Klebsiella oxytoca]AVL79297.1 hypothetical protein CEQ13_03475 [Klebsiella oxytoca]EKX5084693.1 hypothetical protein [Klebsiella oxytoca]EKX5096928.1 hypothetical protein [Klebsiella oxytoca]ELQ8987498.1 hypothetical protein [Klebsiella oxytoca]NDR44241.1 hypothetical protein [Klebsiella oxytoca]